jgi:hypothetical protein
MPYMHPNYMLYQLGFQQVRPVLLPELIFSGGFPVIGESTGELLPTILSVVVNLTTNTQAPNRARKYFAGWAEPQNVDGAPGTGALGAASSFANWVAGYHVLNPAEGIFGAARLEGEFDYAFNPFAALSTKLQWGVQRRRRPGTGI